MVGPMMWFKREPKQEKENGIGGRLKRKKAMVLKPTRESSERETSTESEKEKRRYSDILDIKVSQDRRDESDESLYESADCHSDAISASDDALPRLSKTPTMSKESLKLAVTDEEVDLAKTKKGHRKTMSLSNPLEIVKNLGDEWFDSAKRELEKHSDKKKSRESLWSEEDRDSIHGSTMKLDQIRKNSKKEDKSQPNSRKSSNPDPPKSRKSSKGSSVSALNFLRRKKTPTSAMKVEDVAETVDKVISTEELMNYTRLFLEEEKRYSAVRESRPPVESDSDEEPAPKPLGDHRRRLSRQTSRSKSKVRGKSQSVKVNTLRKSHSGTLKKGKKKIVKTPLVGRSRQTSVVEQTPVMRKKNRESFKHSSWLFSGSRGESRREGSTDETAAPETDVDAIDVAKEQPDKDNNWRAPAPSRGVNRAESCRERDAPRRGKHRNASDPNRLTAHNNHDLEPGAATAPSGSSSSSSLSSRSNESNTVATEHHASQSDLSEEDEVTLPQQWADSLPPRVLETLVLSARRRKRQEVIHELITSEGSHVKWLRALARAFLRPLESSPHLLPPDELRALFPNLPGVRERHNRLYSDLITARNAAEDHVVQLGPIADALLNTLGDSGYAACLSRFCRGQRMALDALKERRRKHKELHQFLASREQLPLCGRLQLRDLLACVWQRLTKYQLLLEGVLKTVDAEDDDDQDAEQDVVRLRRALDVAKDVLHSVDTAIRTAENEHRLKYIQSKLEIRVPTTGTEWDEPRRLDLLAPMRSLRLEAELSVRIDNNKKMPVLALMMEDCLVLLQRDPGDKFLLKPITQSSQQLSPLIKWDKVLFRPNAAVRNTFFLMNINGVQMHELSTSTAQEYSNWVKHIQQLPLVKPELKPSLTPSHQASRSTDDSGINVSRNPSDASEKSTTSTAPDDESERDRASAERGACERDRTSAERSDERDKEEKRSVEREDRRSEDKEEASESEEKHKSRRPTVGRISTHGTEPALPLVDAQAALTVCEPAAVCAHTAERVYTHQERLKRLDEGIARALRAKSAVVSELLGIPAGSFAQMAELAVAETLGQVDVCNELRSTQSLSRSSSVEEQSPPCAPDMHQLLLAAQAQANQLTETLAKALTVNEASHVASRVSRRDRCDSCRSGTGRRRPLARSDTLCTTKEGDEGITEDEELAGTSVDPQEDSKLSTSELDKDSSYDMLVELGADDALETDSSAATLATRLVGGVCGLQATLGRLLAALPALTDERRALRQHLAAARDLADARRHRAGYPMTEEISFPKDSLDQSIQDQPSNGG